MLVIGLVSGDAAERSDLIARVCELSPERFCVFGLPEGVDAQRRLDALDKLLDEYGTKFRKHQGALINVVETAEEAQLLRDKGGVLWHLISRPSATIPILGSDLMVGSRPSAGVLDVEEALSQTYLACKADEFAKR